MKHTKIFIIAVFVFLVNIQSIFAMEINETVIKDYHYKLLSSYRALENKYPIGYFVYKNKEGKEKLFLYYEGNPHSEPDKNSNYNLFTNYPNKFYSSENSSEFIYIGYKSEDPKKYITQYGKINMKGPDELTLDGGESNQNSNPQNTNQDTNSGKLSGIINKLNQLISSITGFFTDLINVVKAIPEKISEVLKFLFIPNENYLTNKFNEVKRTMLSRFNIDFLKGTLDDLQNIKAKPFKNIEGKIQEHSVTFVNFDFLNKNLSGIKTFTDGFFWLLFLFMQYNEIMNIIRKEKPIKGDKSDDN